MKRIGKTKKGVEREFRDELWKNMLCYKEAKRKQMFEQYISDLGEMKDIILKETSERIQKCASVPLS